MSLRSLMSLMGSTPSGAGSCAQAAAWETSEAPTKATILSRFDDLILGPSDLSRSGSIDHSREDLSDPELPEPTRGFSEVQDRRMRSTLTTCDPRPRVRLVRWSLAWCCSRA